MEDNRTLATFAVYWPGLITYCCERHKEELVHLGTIMGINLKVDQLHGTTFGDCKNCINESKNKP